MTSKMRLGDEGFIAVDARELPHAHVYLSDVTVEFGTEQKLFCAKHAGLFPVGGGLLVTAQHVLIKMTFDYRLVGAMFARVPLRVRVEHFVAGKHVALQR